MKIGDVVKSVIIFVFVGFLLHVNVSSLDVNESKLRDSVQDAIWQVVGISHAYAGEKRDKASKENERACKKWCADNKDKCKKCGKRSCGVGYKHIETWGGFGTNWYACTLNTTEKWVNIQNEGSGKCLDVAERSKDDGGNIQQWGCKKDTNQLFKVEINEDGGVYIVNQGSERCLDVTDFSNENGANIQQWGCKKDTNQLFEFIEIKPGWYNIKSLYNDKCLDVTDLSTKDGANIQQWGCKVGGNQSFKLLD